jgi:hypothetical protein
VVLHTVSLFEALLLRPDVIEAVSEQLGEADVEVKATNVLIPALAYYFKLSNGLVLASLLGRVAVVPVR